MTAVEAYSPGRDLWVTMPALPTGRSGMAAAALDGKLYVTGGELPRIFPENQEFDPVRKRWRSVAPMTTPRHGMWAVVFGNTLFLIGGATRPGYAASGINEGFIPGAGSP